MQRLATVVLALWAAIGVLVGGLLLVRHLIALPTPPASDPQLHDAVATLFRDPSRWGAVHVMYRTCSCSQRTIAHLLATPRPADLDERVVMVDDDGAPGPEDAALRAAGFAVEVVTPQALQQRFHVVSAPLLVVARPDHELAYVGGYNTHKQSAAYENLAIIADLRRNEDRAALPSVRLRHERAARRQLRPARPLSLVIREIDMNRLIQYLRLPREITSFEARYLQRMNRVALVFFWLHPPVFVLVAALAGTSCLLALVLSLGVIVGPTLAYFALASRPRLVSITYGFTAMLMGGVLVYVGQGPMQIEMHFYFFVLIALLAVFGNPQVILVAAVTVAAHHLVVWLVVPRGVFNYDASMWTVAVHALFVVLESVAACFVARSFFDNVIGLEKIVTRRTGDLDARNRDMTLILDNVGQGLVMVGLDGSLGAERSRILARWFGTPTSETRIWSYLAAHDPNLEAWIELSFGTIRDGFLPVELAIGQLPNRLARDDRQFRVDYQPIGEPASALLVVVSDITDELARQRAEGAQRELIAVVEHAYRDRVGFLAFIREADELVEATARANDEPLAEVQRRLHTLKGNAALFGVNSVAEICHELEDRIAEDCAGPDAAGRAKLCDAWRTFHQRIERLLGISKRRTILVDWQEYQSVLALLEEPEPQWARPIRRWGQDATRPHLERFAEQARQLAVRLGKTEIEVEIQDQDVRVESDHYLPVWSALTHSVRNAIDHGIEAPELRVAAGKPARGKLTFRTSLQDDELQIEVEDDGGGIDWNRVAERAAELGLPAKTRHELEEAVFANGMSTAAEITEISGRGVGMNALRAACAALGGRVELCSERGAGTTVRCRLPATSIAGAARVWPATKIEPAASLNH